MNETPVYLRTPRPVSNSEVSTYKRCKRKWYLGQFRGLRPKGELPEGPAYLGDRVHQALADYYDPEIQLTPDDVLTKWEAESVRLLEAHPTLLDLESDAALGRLMLEGYFQWLEEEGADADLEILSAERNLSVPVENYRGPRPIALVAKTDVKALRRSNGSRLFIDHKTVDNLTNLPKQADLAEQFLHYDLVETLDHLAQGDSPDATFVDGGMYNMLRKVKRTVRANPPFFGRHDVRHTRDRLRTYWTRLLGEVSDMQRTEDQLMDGMSHHAVAYPTPTRDCDWDCEFRAVCPMLDDPTAAGEEFLAEAYVVGDPYVRYEPRAVAGA